MWVPNRLSICILQVQDSCLENSTWYLDSGYSRHMIGNSKLLTDITRCSGPRITFGDNSKGKTVGKGKIIHGTITINNIFLVENLSYNLISISQLCDNGYLVEFQKEICYVRDQ